MHLTTRKWPVIQNQQLLIDKGKPLEHAGTWRVRSDSPTLTSALVSAWTRRLYSKLPASGEGDPIMSTSQRVSRGVHRLAFFCARSVRHLRVSPLKSPTHRHNSQCSASPRREPASFGRTTIGFRRCMSPTRTSSVSSTVIRIVHRSEAPSENFARPINPVSSWQGKSAGCYRTKGSR